MSPNQSNGTLTVQSRKKQVILIGVLFLITVGISVFFLVSISHNPNDQIETPYKVDDFERSRLYSTFNFRKIQTASYTAYIDKNLRASIILQTDEKGLISAFQVNKFEGHGNRKDILAITNELLRSVDHAANTNTTDLEMRFNSLGASGIDSIGSSKIFNTQDPKTASWNGFGCNTNHSKPWTADKDSDLLYKFGFLTAQIFVDKGLIVSRKGTVASDSKTINTYRDFEQCQLFQELNFSNIRNQDDYRIYRDQNNNYLITLQVGRDKRINALRIVPLPLTPTRAQNQGMLFFIADFLFGDGTSKNAAGVLDMLKPYAKTIATAAGCDINQTHISQISDATGIRAGLEIRKPLGRRWDLSFEKTMTGTSGIAIDGRSQTRTLDSDTKDRDIARLKQEVTNLDSKLEKLKLDYESKENRLQDALFTQKNKNEEMESALGNTKRQMQEIKDSTRTAYLDVKSTTDQLRSELADLKLQKPEKESESAKPPIPMDEQQARSLASDELMSQIPGFSASAYREHAAQRISRALLAVEIFEPGQTSVELEFRILSDGSPAEITMLRMQPPRDINDTTDLIAKLKRVIESAGPFRPMSPYSVQYLTINLKIDQAPSGGLIHSIEYAAKPVFITSLN